MSIFQGVVMMVLITVVMVGWGIVYVDLCGVQDLPIAFCAL